LPFASYKPEHCFAAHETRNYILLHMNMKGGLRTWGLKVTENKEIWGCLDLIEIRGAWKNRYEK